MTSKKLFSVTWLIAGLLCGLLCARVSLATDPQAAMAQAQAECERFLSSIVDIQLDQTMVMTAGGDSSVMNQKIFRRANQSRTEIRGLYPPSPFGDTPTVVINSDSGSWLVSVMERRALEPEEASDFAAEKLCWDFKGHDATPVGSRMVNGRELIELAMSEGENSFSIELDPIDGLVLSGHAFGGENDSVGWEYSDFRDVGTGYRLPFRTTMYAGNTPMSVLTVNSVKINQGLSDDLFDARKVTMPSLEEFIRSGSDDQK